MNTNIYDRLYWLYSGDSAHYLERCFKFHDVLNWINLATFYNYLATVYFDMISNIYEGLYWTYLDIFCKYQARMWYDTISYIYKSILYLE